MNSVNNNYRHSMVRFATLPLLFSSRLSGGGSSITLISAFTNVAKILPKKIQLPPLLFSSPMMLPRTSRSLQSNRSQSSRHVLNSHLTMMLSSKSSSSLSSSSSSTIEEDIPCGVLIPPLPPNTVKIRFTGQSTSEGVNISNNNIDGDNNKDIINGGTILIGAASTLERYIVVKEEEGNNMEEDYLLKSPLVNLFPASAVATIKRQSLQSLLEDAKSSSIGKEGEGGGGGASSLYDTTPNSNYPHRVTIRTLPEKNTISRNNHILSPHIITDVLRESAGFHFESAIFRKCKSRSSIKEETTSTNKKNIIVELNIIVVGVDVDDDTVTFNNNLDLDVAGDDCTPTSVAMAIGKAFPLYSARSTIINDNDKDDEPKIFREACVTFLPSSQPTITTSPPSVLDRYPFYSSCCEAAVDGVRLAAALTDAPPNELDVSTFANVVRRSLLDDTNLIEKGQAKTAITSSTLTEGRQTIDLNVVGGGTLSYTEIVGEELKECGYGGLYAVGKCAISPPRLVIAEYLPPDAIADVVVSNGINDNGENDSSLLVEKGVVGKGKKTDKQATVLVGKGIVFDTGGLSLKSKDGMPGMKHDMAGAAACLGAFLTALRLRSLSTDNIKNNNEKNVGPISLVLCLAENAIGPNAVRNDDIVTLHSKRTVEINNSDAEGRLVLADGCSHACTYLNPNLIIDVATLTGAQLIATGRKHAGILANTQRLEERMVNAGLVSGDLTFPLLYCPEMLNDEFKSKVADMKNSVKDRGNAQSSCAGHFIERHLSNEYKEGWVHVDMAGPGTKEERGTGYGVGLLCSMLGVKGF